VRPRADRLLIPDLSKWRLKRRLGVARIVFFEHLWAGGRRTLSSVDFVFVSGVDGLRLSTDWSPNHVIALRVGYSDIFEGFGVLRLAGSRLISVDAVIFLTRSSLISKLFGSWWRRPGAIDGLLAQSGNRGALSILCWLSANLNVYW
jgi:hypothetical protein